MRGMDGNETCPICYRVMVELADFDARADALGPDTGGWGPYSYRSYEYSLLEGIGEWFAARVRQWRLSRVARRWPRSMYCPGCGYLIKRR
jgi:hypothetical protein